MPQTLYCWRCGTDMPMLDEREYEQLLAQRRPLKELMQRYRDLHGGASPKETAELLQDVLDEYERITGFKETNPNAIWHHRLSLYGPPCKACGKPLRTPRATFCAACGASA